MIGWMSDDLVIKKESIDMISLSEYLYEDIHYTMFILVLHGVYVFRE